MRFYEMLNQTTYCGIALGFYLKIKDMSDIQLFRLARYLWKRAEPIRLYAERNYLEAPQSKSAEADNAFELTYYRLMDLRGTDWIINTPLFDAVYKELRKRGIRLPDEIMEAVAKRNWAGI
jgi:hypothetical protein